MKWRDVEVVEPTDEEKKIIEEYIKNNHQKEILSPIKPC